MKIAKSMTAAVTAVVLSAGIAGFPVSGHAFMDSIAGAITGGDEKKSGKPIGEQAEDVRVLLGLATNHFIDAAQVVAEAVEDNEEVMKAASTLTDLCKNGDDACVKGNTDFESKISGKKIDFSKLSKEKALKALLDVSLAGVYDKRAIDAGGDLMDNASATDLTDSAVSSAVSMYKDFASLLPQHIELGAGWIDGLTTYLKDQNIDMSEVSTEVAKAEDVSPSEAKGAEDVFPG
ncbi:hypothetical protein V5T82_15090 [Magnetovibrio sp. PR-2]|uniref:hypothetical protein n=1 Tax=Magnetovibrio sp. PR-2 TaxID=3120356 RepID=UPI002FCDED56